jgi:hypothetical protein
MGDISTWGKVRTPPPAPQPNPPLFSFTEDDQVVRSGTYELKASLDKFTGFICIHRYLGYPLILSEINEVSIDQGVIDILVTLDTLHM